jgi:hypothetical protein
MKTVEHSGCVRSTIDGRMHGSLSRTQRNTYLAPNLTVPVFILPGEWMQTLRIYNVKGMKKNVHCMCLSRLKMRVFNQAPKVFCMIQHACNMFSSRYYFGSQLFKVRKYNTDTINVPYIRLHFMQENLIDTSEDLNFLCLGCQSNDLSVNRLLLFTFSLLRRV